MKKIFVLLLLIIMAAAAGSLIYSENKGDNMEKRLSLNETDPEFSAFFSDFAEKEVGNYGALDKLTRHKVVLASLIATQGVDLYKVKLNEALEDGITPVEVKEIVYQAVPYVGLSKVYEFFAATNEVLTERGIKLPLDGQSTTNPESRFEKGLALQKSIFGGRIDDMRKNAPQNQKHIQDYLSANCFGDYYTRNGLDVKMRELVTFTLLVSLGGVEAQVKGHIQGNLNVGNDKEVLLETVTQLLPYIGYPRTLNAISALNEISPE